MKFNDLIEIDGDVLSKLKTQIDYHIKAFQYDKEQSAKARLNRRLSVYVMPVLWNYAINGVILTPTVLVGLLYDKETNDTEYLECRYINFYRGLIRELDVACKIKELCPEAKIFRSNTADLKHGIDLFVKIKRQKCALQVSINGRNHEEYKERKDSKKDCPTIELLASSKDKSCSIPLVKKKQIVKALGLEKSV